MTKIQAVVFDLDGTLIDTSELIFRAYEHSIALHGLPVPNRSTLSSLIGKKLEDCYKELFPDGDNDSLIREHRGHQPSIVHLVQSFENAKNVIDLLKESGLALSIWTSRASSVYESLSFAGLEKGSFDVVLTGEDVSVGKPDPEGLMTCLDKIHVRPENAIMVGDAGVDILAGRRGGVANTVGLTHGFGTREELEAAEADYIIDSLIELPKILEKIELL